MMLSHITLKDKEITLAKEIAPKYNELLYTNPHAAALHRSLDAVYNLKVLRLVEGRVRKSKKNQRTCFLESPALTIAFSRDQTQAMELFVRELCKFEREKLKDSVVDMKLIFGNSYVGGETAFRFPALIVSFVIPPNMECKTQQDKEFIESSLNFIWQNLLTIHHTAFGKSFRSEFYPRKASVCFENPNPNSLTDLIIKQLLKEDGFDENSNTVSCDLKRAITEFTKHKALYRLIGYSDAINTPPIDIGSWRDFYDQEDYFPFMFLKNKKAKDKVITFLVKDESDVLMHIEDSYTDDSVFPESYLIVSYLLREQKLLYASTFEALSEHQVRLLFSNSTDNVFLSQDQEPKLLSDLFIQVDSSYKE